MVGVLEKQEVKEIIRQFPATPMGRVLDVGTGDGRFLDTLKECGISDAVGLEPRADLVDTGRRMGRTIHQAYFDVDSVPSLNGQKFDVVCFRESIYYMCDLKKTFGLLRSVLQPNGRVYIKCHSVESIYYQFHPDRRVRYGSELRFYPSMKWGKGLLEHNGYRVLKSGYFPFDVLKTLSLPLQGTRIGWVISPLFNFIGRGDRFYIFATRGGKGQ